MYPEESTDWVWNGPMPWFGRLSSPRTHDVGQCQEDLARYLDRVRPEVEPTTKHVLLNRAAGHHNLN